MTKFRDIRLFTGNANKPLAEEIATYLGLPLSKATVKRFSDGEVWVEIHENVRMMDAYVIQPTCRPANENLMELLIMIDALKRASVDTITAVVPYYGYARQDRKVQPRTPITSKLVADVLTTAGADRVVSIDLHAGQIQGFFNIPFDHLFGLTVFMDHFSAHPLDNLVVVSPDTGGTERARAYAKRLGGSLALIDKRRPAPNVSQVMHVIGDVDGKNAVLVDDIVDTGGTLVQAAEALIERGVKKVYACCTHAVLSGPAIHRIQESQIEKLWITNTIPLSTEGTKCSKIEQISIAGLLGEAISRIANGDSVSSLFV
ncbi:MAG: phosphoribosylpyrophosphate synthetase [Deltaproteobacteria bacterium RIFCSPLOWO2_12_FULL_40_28]|nr:MAG: phosphoribosylpyrophosphate synthetase [Deltaproteobacteria bacterium RIFCSPHIGHO2_02_FULL_40_28]OGQ19338.1 MAG: phosphoribosylpyrophosphate synthetase [Deltaproteobacteria bacterium RIFCSPHIGHO2_12_FULL_40_32]OGQ40438.1 MAG: phosphoribosylpyrophosphate synthetase [Deltaproteobacteria bacterium RIFCSPLOWO2_02_FULL_40_36]OGQ53674.1 MAG: phosphoribosylpyrophosphate synthetase [Deltaproteobacteria bacterium RIFCSPLOWO2_12_FULL_40_28]